MSQVFLVCAVIGGTWMLCQFAMTLMGFGGDHDGASEISHAGASSGNDGSAGADDAADGHDHSDSLWFFKIVTIRTLTAAIAFFGLAGLGVQSSGGSPLQALSGGVVAGVAAMWVVHWLMQQMTRFDEDGTVHLDRLVGLTGTVYLKIPGGQSAAGKVHVTAPQGTVELSAWTSGPEIPTGSTVRVTAMIGHEAVEVAPFNVAEELQHA